MTEASGSRRVALDGAWLRRQLAEALNTYFTPITGAANAVSTATRPGKAAGTSGREKRAPSRR